MTKKKTVGVSPKAPAAAVAALVAPLLARLIGDAAGIEVDSEVVEGLILAAIAALGALGGAAIANPGNVVVTERSDPLKPNGQAGYGAVELVVVVLVILILVFVLLRVA